jgi:hypothetical protein
MKIVNRNVSSQGGRKGRRVGFHYEDELNSKLPFLSSRVIIRHMIRFSGYKYQRPDPCKNIYNLIQNLFGFGHQS